MHGTKQDSTRGGHSVLAEDVGLDMGLGDSSELQYMVRKDKGIFHAGVELLLIHHHGHVVLHYRNLLQSV